MTERCASEVTDAELIRNMLLHDEAAWRTFLRRYDPLIYATIDRIMRGFARRCDVERDDVYASLMLGLLARDMHKLRTFDFTRGTKLSSWIVLLATHATWDKLRASRREPWRAPPDKADAIAEEHGGPFDALSASRSWQATAALLAALPKRDRQFVELFFLQGHSPEHVATTMHISVRTVYTKKHKLKRRLERALRGSDVAEPTRRRPRRPSRPAPVLALAAAS
ncbi:MAG: sigma-70 family RNA polymerase sigma factor [Polyangiales bacterium]